MTHGVLRQVVAQLQFGIFQEPCKFPPQRERVLAGLAERTGGQWHGLCGLDLATDIIQQRLHKDWRRYLGTHPPRPTSEVEKLEPSSRITHGERLASARRFQFRLSRQHNRSRDPQSSQKQTGKSEQRFRVFGIRFTSLPSSFWRPVTDWRSELDQHGIFLSDQSSVFDLTAEVQGAIDRYISRTSLGATDLSEMAQQAATLNRRRPHFASTLVAFRKLFF